MSGRIPSARTIDNDTPSVEAIVTRPPVSEPPNDALGRIESLLTNMSGRLDYLEQRIVRQEQATPRFQPMQPAEALNPPRAAALGALTRPDQAANGGQQVPTRANAAGVLSGYPQRFRQDDFVRLNPEAGAGEVLQRRGKADVASMVGTVVGLHYIDKLGEVKYRVNFPGLTNKRGDGFRESELLPA